MTARTGMANLISRLRGLCEAGTADYSIIDGNGTVSYWSGDKLQEILDNHRFDIYREHLTQIINYADGGTIEYLTYRSDYGDFEETTGGTAIFYVELSTGEAAGTATYSVDYQKGIITFTSDRGGTAYYLTGRSYNLNAAAADVWRMKAAHLAQTAMDFSTDGHRFNRSQLVENALKMADYFERKGGGVQSVEMFS